MKTTKLFLLVVITLSFSCSKDEDKKEDTFSYYVSTLAGSNSSGFENGTSNIAKFYYPTGVAVDASGNVYVGDSFNHKIRKITSTGLVTTFAGSSSGFANGTGENAKFEYPSGVAADASGNIYVADRDNHIIRKITPTGTVSILAGSGAQGFNNGSGANVTFRSPTGVAVDASGNIYVADAANSSIRKITSNGEVSTLAGTGVPGFENGNGTSAQFSIVSGGVAVDASGNIYVADSDNHSIRKITSAGVVSTLAGSGTEGFADGNGTNAQFSYPVAVAVDASGNVYVADSGNDKIRKITSAGVVSTIAGTGTYGFADGSGTNAQFDNPSGIAVDANGTIYVADRGNHKIRKIELKKN